ncbi:glycosyl hydrolase family protein [Actinidia rufa]|uniref:Glycosyl hydrolase family protein n=1 Tax=Actinidia rufa TaxID=165716 RepID=A0A7J0FE16_9ERIC|nr:glycosyl hydrolase family protein [Actinidia rufa]
MKLHIFSLINLIFLTTLHQLIFTESTPPFACDSANPSTNSYPFCKPTLPVLHRVRDLVSRLTLDKKVSNASTRLPRLPVVVGGAAQHCRLERMPTNFPQVILTCVAFDPHLWYRIGRMKGLDLSMNRNKDGRLICDWEGGEGGVQRGASDGDDILGSQHKRVPGPAIGAGPGDGRRGPSGCRLIRGVVREGIQGDRFGGGALRGGHLQASACCKYFTA